MNAMTYFKEVTDNAIYYKTGGYRSRFIVGDSYVHVKVSNEGKIYALVTGNESLQDLLLITKVMKSDVLYLGFFKNILQHQKIESLFDSLAITKSQPLKYIPPDKPKLDQDKSTFKVKNNSAHYIHPSDESIRRLPKASNLKKWMLLITEGLINRMALFAALTVLVGAPVTLSLFATQHKEEQLQDIPKENLKHDVKE